MNYFFRYVEYLKDNPRGYWFKRKLYGWGWTPARWQGWVSLLILIGIFLWRVSVFVHIKTPTKSDVNFFVIETLIFAIAVITLAWLKGEPPKWQWGIPKK